MKWWKPALAIGALAAAPFALPLIGAALGGTAAAAGSGALAGGAAAGLEAGAGTSAASGALGGITGGGLGGILSGLGHGLGALGPMALQGGLGYLLGGPQGAAQVPLMAAAGRAQDPGGQSGILGALGGHSGISALLGGLAGRAMGGQGGGLAGIGMGGLLNPWGGPLQRKSPVTKPPIPGALPMAPQSGPAQPWWMQPTAPGVGGP